MENKELPAARHAVGALSLEEDPVVAAFLVFLYSPRKLSASMRAPKYY
jgi:hypothetical protein